MHPTPSLFKSVLVGYAVGAGALFLPTFLLFVLPSMATQANIGLWKALGIFALLPIILIAQGVILGGVIKFGWWLLGLVRRSRS